MSNNLYNILAAFNNATKPAEVETPKQQAQKIYESVEAKGSIIGGVKGVEKKLAEAFAKHKVEESSHADSFKSETDSMKPGTSKYVGRKGGKEVHAKKDASGKVTFTAKDGIKGKGAKVEEGKMSDLDYELKAKEVSDSEFKKKYGKSKADMKKSMSGKKDEKKPVKESQDLSKVSTEKLQAFWNKHKDEPGISPVFGQQLKAIARELARRKQQGVTEADVYEPWYDDEAETTTQDTDTGRIHKAGKGGYGNKFNDEEPSALPAGQVARGRGRPKGLPALLRAQKAAELAAKGIDPNAPRGRGRPKKNPAAGDANSAPQGTLGLHRFLFGPMPTKLPGKPGVKNKIADVGTEKARVAKIRGESVSESVAPKGNLKGYLSESFQNPGSDAFEHILHRFKNEVKRFQAGEDMDQDLYDALFDYYLNSGEMPYGVAKARSGDPYEWVCQRFGDEMPMDEAVDPLTVPAVHRKAQGQAPLSLDQVRAPRADSISDKRNLNVANGNTKELDDLARLAGITTESVSVIDGGHNPEEMMGDSGQEDKMNISTNQSSDGTKSITVTADGEAAVALLDMLKNAGMGASDAAAQQEVIIATQGDEHMGDEMSMGDSGAEVEMEEEYANEPAPAYQSVEKITSAGDDMNRQKKQNFPLRAPGNNPMSEMSIDPGKSMGRDLMAEYQAMKLQK